MTRSWLTSTTAIALILHTAAPLPAFAEGDQAANDASQTLQTDFGENATVPTTATEAARAAQDVIDAELAQAAAKVQADADAAAKAQAEAEAQKAAQAEAEAAAAAKTQADAQAAEDAAQAEAKAAETEAQKAAQAQADADAAKVQAESDAAAKAQAESDAAAKAQADADAAAKAQADAQVAEDAAQARIKAEKAAQAEADAAAKAQADAQAVEDAAQAEAKAKTAEAEAEKAALAQAEADAKAQAEAKAQADARAAQEAAANSKEGSSQAQGNVAKEIGESAQPLTPANAQSQADAVQRSAEQAAQSAAAASGAEAVSTSEGTVTEEDARASDEEFSTTASGEIQTQVAPAKKKDNDTLKVVGAIAALGLGAYVVGRLLDDGGRVVSNTGDRAVIQDPNGTYRILKDDDVLLRRPGSDVRTETFSDGSTRAIVTAADGSRTITVRAANGQVLRRSRVLADGREVTLFDDTQRYEPVDVSTLRPARPSSDYDYSTAQVDDLRAALTASSGATLTDRAFSLNQIRRIDAVRHLVPVIALDEINFETGSAVIRPDEAQALSVLGTAMLDAIDANPAQVFLIEGHTDTVGDARYNLALSDRRAESVALALTEYFDVPPANMVVQGYGESDLRILREGNIRGNRRGAVRNITPLLTGTD